jgi:hypothetical protein
MTTKNAKVDRGPRCVPMLVKSGIKHIKTELEAVATSDFYSLPYGYRRSLGWWHDSRQGFHVKTRVLDGDSLQKALHLLDYREDRRVSAER